jgi:hypothetical protein
MAVVMPQQAGKDILSDRQFLTMSNKEWRFGRMKFSHLFCWWFGLGIWMKRFKSPTSPEFANGACIYTDSVKAIRQFREEIDAGMFGVNVAVPAPMAFIKTLSCQRPRWSGVLYTQKDGDGGVLKQ